MDLTNNLITLNPLQIEIFIDSLDHKEKTALKHFIKNEQTDRIDALAGKCLQASSAEAKRVEKKTIRSKTSACFYRFYKNLCKVFSTGTFSWLGKLWGKSCRSCLIEKLRLFQSSDAKGAKLSKKEFFTTLKKGLPFTVENLDLSHCNLSNHNLAGVTFKNCSFVDTKFAEATLTNCKFLSCNLDNTYFGKAFIENTLFKNTKIKYSSFTTATIKNSQYLSCSILGSSFEDSQLNNVEIANSNLPSTHFLNTTVTNSKINNCSLRNTVFFGNKNSFSIDTKSKQSHKITSPICAFITHPTGRGITTPKSKAALKKNKDLIILKINFLPESIQSTRLTEEVKGGLNRMNNIALSRADEYIKMVSSGQIKGESQKIVNKASLITDYVDSVYFPGGEDVPPSFYGEEAHPKTNWGNDYRRSILEFALINQVRKKNIPLMGVCRGHQMISVYYGASMNQRASGQESFQKLKVLSDKKGLVADCYKGKSLNTISSHVQGVLASKGPKQEELEVVSVYDNYVKACQSPESKSPIISLQFHPEYLDTSTSNTLRWGLFDLITNLYISSRNKNFFDTFIEQARQHREKALLY